MCRFVAYLGDPVFASELLIKPKNSLLSQSINAQESEMTVNGDGFGIGWYNKHIRKEPALYRSIRPAWNEENLIYNASMIQSNCLLGHVRAATNGSVSLANCHPFHYNDFLMMQNGSIEEFGKIKRLMINRMDDEALMWIQGQTDTQYIFALFMTIARELSTKKKVSFYDATQCFLQTFQEIEEMKKEKRLDSPSLYNLVFTNGEQMAATRYSTQPEKDTRSLHLARVSKFYRDDQGFLQFDDADEDNKSVLISSEVIGEDDVFWTDVPENTCIIVDKNLNVKEESII